MRHLPILTNSAEKTWRQCARLYELSYERLIKPLQPGEALVFGDMIHRALEQWWLAAQAFPKPECVACGGDGTLFDAPPMPCETCSGTGIDRKSWLGAALVALSDDQDPFRRAVLEALMLGYHERWQDMTWHGAPYDGAPMEVLAVEREFTAPLTNPSTGKPSKSLQRGGKIDALVRVRIDKAPGMPAMVHVPFDTLPVWVVEHKSSGEDFSPGSDYRRRLRLDTQVSGYHVGARALNLGSVAGVLYDVIGKPGLRPQKATPRDKQKWTKPTKTQPSRLYSGQRETDESVDEFQSRVIDWIAGGDAYARFEVTRLAHEEEAAARDTWQRAQEIRDARRLGRFPRNASSCGMYGRTCAYLPICEGTATENDGTRYRRAKTAHEELGHGPANDLQREEKAA